MFTLTCRAARLSPAKEKRHDDIRIPPARQPERPPGRCGVPHEAPVIKLNYFALKNPGGG
jgi:hypothetical protein